MPLMLLSMRPAEQGMRSFRKMLALHLHLHRPLPLCSCGVASIGRSGPAGGCIVEKIVFHHLQQHAWVAEPSRGAVGRH